MEQVKLPDGAWAAIVRALKSASLPIPLGEAQAFLNMLDGVQPEPIEEPTNENRTET